MPCPAPRVLSSVVNMSTIDPHTCLADIVCDRPLAAAMFDSLSLDYCCGGQQTLDVACRAVGVDVDTVINQLLNETPDEAPDDWLAMSPTDLVDHLEQTHHRYLSAALPRLDALAVKVAEVHGELHHELHAVAATMRELREDLEPHLLKEERVLFPMIRELYASDAVPVFHCGTLQNPIRMMTLEHDRAGELLEKLRELTSGYAPPSTACASYTALYGGLDELEADTHIHIHKENHVLFPAVVAEESNRRA